MIVAEATAQVVDVNFITASASSAQAFKTATLLKTLNISVLIFGEIGVGKRSLARYIAPNATVVDASDGGELLKALASCGTLIITNLERSSNVKNILELASANNTRIIATAQSLFLHDLLDKHFSVKFEIPPLSGREEDVQKLIELFIEESAITFSTPADLKMKDFKPNLRENAKSLRRQVFLNCLFQDIDEIEIMEMLEGYLASRLGSSNDYDNFLHIYEVPLIRAGMEKFKSQLQLSDRLGLNRNTLRKKIQQNSKYLGEI